jgi:hypothetical protein
VLTIKTWLKGIGLQEPIEECPAWPPDLFALAGTLIRRSGAYLRVFQRRDPTAYAKDIATAGRKWRRQLDAITLDAKDVTPADLKEARTPDVLRGWSRLIQAKGRGISAIGKLDELAEDLIRLTLIADEASRGIGVTWNNKTARGKGKRSQFLSMAGRALADKNNESYCWDVPTEALCVVGKQHTPMKGATFRSLSHHLALYHPSEIKAIWILPPAKTVERPRPRPGLNLLLLPWPERVETPDFQQISIGAMRTDGSEPPTYFRYDPKETSDPTHFEKRLREALRRAHEHAGPIDAIVFPELALTKSQYDAAERIAFEARSILICGLRQARPAEGDWDSNVSVLQVAGAVREAVLDSTKDDDLLKDLRLGQAKHHRWYLDHDQIINYQLGGALLPSRGAWEHVELKHPRVLHFVTVNATTWSVLICEDLARQDPAADLIRAVGPNLLIALLMDGPQLSNRWPARYAAVLAEDPGTSVLTLTSLGMAERSRPILGSGQRAPVSRVIALWRDAIEGEIQIALDADHNACVLNLEYQMKTEYCADGRSDYGQTRYPVYAGYRSFKVEDTPKTAA